LPTHEAAELGPPDEDDREHCVLEPGPSAAVIAIASTIDGKARTTSTTPHQHFVHPSARIAGHRPDGAADHPRDQDHAERRGEGRVRGPRPITLQSICSPASIQRCMDWVYTMGVPSTKRICPVN
jgi:hypothetical protein